MSTTFSRSMRSVERDGFRLTLTVLLVAAALLVAWSAWFFLASVPRYVRTDVFHLDVSGASTQVVAELSAMDAAEVRLHQAAWLRLPGRRAIAARVSRVGDARVELLLQDIAGPIPSGSTIGTVEIEVERVAPATLVLRSLRSD